MERERRNEGRNVKCDYGNWTAVSYYSDDYYDSDYEEE